MVSEQSNSKSAKKTISKAQMFYAHTYRHLKPQGFIQLMYLIVLVIPSCIIMLFNYSGLSYFLSSLTKDILNFIQPGVVTGISGSSFLPHFGDVFFIELESAQASVPLILGTLLVFVLILFILNLSKLRGLPATVFLNMSMFLMLASCIFFLFAPNDFPYTATEYAQLYMEQQISIWLFFVMLSGLVITFVGKERVDLKIAIYLAILLYSFIFGVIRYVAFMLVISQFSMLYSVVLYFTFGPLFDFLYFVMFYSIYIDKLSRYYDINRKKKVWAWM